MGWKLVSPLNSQANALPGCVLVFGDGALGGDQD